MKTLNIVYVDETNIVKMEQDLIAYGESHFNPDEVEAIRDMVSNEYTKNTIILHELSRMDRKYYEKKGMKIEPLEKRVKSKNDMKLDFLVRESDMISRIDDALEKYDRVIVVVGDTHLRSIKTKELGDPHLHEYLMSLKNVNVSIHRSPNGEIR